MKKKVRIQGFKCFEDNTFEFNKITLLTGSNGSGKSSVIQALLLMNLSYDINDTVYMRDKTFTTVVLNGKYELNLGLFDDVINQNSKHDFFTVTYGGVEYLFSSSDDQSNLESLQVERNEPKHSDDMLRLTYLNAERVGPRYNSDTSHTHYTHCGFKGENTARVINENAKKQTKVILRKRLNDIKAPNFSIQLDHWLDYICPGISVTVNEISPFFAQITLRNNKKTSVAPNIGFGISYLLPILVDGLLAEKDSTLIVENPEAHLHPQAQSNLGFFLGQMAGSGVRIILETHSEHIVNGVRRAAMSDIGLNHKDINIYFFDTKEIIDKESHQPVKKLDYELITVDQYGNLSDFPIDFFDQARQDMHKIIQLARIKQARSQNNDLDNV